MNTLKKVTGLILIYFALFFHGAVVAVPYIDKPEVRQDKWNTIAYARIVWPFESSEEKVYCESILGCTLRLCLREIKGTTCRRDMDFSTLFYPNGATMKNIRELWVKEYGSVSREFRFKDAFSTKCIVMTADLYDQLPGMLCRPLISPAIRCTVSDSLNFVYNTLSSEKVDNAETYSDLVVTCNGNATVELTLAGEKKIDLGRGGTLTASLNVNNQDLSDGYSFEAKGTSITLKILSTLHSSLKEADAGLFNGQGIIVMNIY